MNNEVISILTKTFGDYESSDGNELKFDCPKCAEEYNFGVKDGKFNLQINIGKKSSFNNNSSCKILTNCWKCGETSLYNLFKNYGKVEDYYQISKIDPSLIKPNIPLLKPLFLPYGFISLKDIILNEDTYRINKYKEYFDYLYNKRCVTKQQIIDYNIGIIPREYNSLYKGRIILPSYDQNNKLNYYITRSVFDDITPKYLIPTYPKIDVIFNESNINWFSPVYLVEGYFELTALPVNTICLLGKVLLPNSLLEKRIIEYKPKIILCLNNDAYNSVNNKKKIKKYSSANSSIDIYNRLITYDIDVKIIKMPTNDDLNDTLKIGGKEKILDLFNNN